MKIHILEHVVKGTKVDKCVARHLYRSLTKLFIKSPLHACPFVLRIWRCQEDLMLKINWRSKQHVQNSSFTRKIQLNNKDFETYRWSQWCWLPFTYANWQYCQNLYQDFLKSIKSLGKKHTIFWRQFLKETLYLVGSIKRICSPIKIHGKFVHPKVQIVNEDTKIWLHELVHTKKWNVHHKEKFPHNGTNSLIKLNLLGVKHWLNRQIVESLLHVHVLWKNMEKHKTT